RGHGHRAELVRRPAGGPAARRGVPLTETGHPQQPGRHGLPGPPRPQLRRPAGRGPGPARRPRARRPDHGGVRLRGPARGHAPAGLRRHPGPLPPHPLRRSLSRPRRTARPGPTHARPAHLSPGAGPPPAPRRQSYLTPRPRQPPPTGGSRLRRSRTRRRTRRPAHPPRHHQSPTVPDVAHPPLGTVTPASRPSPPRVGTARNRPPPPDLRKELLTAEHG